MFSTAKLTGRFRFKQKRGCEGESSINAIGKRYDSRDMRRSPRSISHNRLFISVL